jgi:hypothetical protein
MTQMKCLHRQRPRGLPGAVLLLLLGAALRLHAGENAPHTPFGEWSSTLPKGELMVRATYQESEAYYFWAGHTRYKSDFILRGEHYGIDMNQGFLSFQYGLNDNWTADLAFGFTTVGWRFFNNFGTNGSAQSTTGLMDISMGLRFQVLKEGEYWSFTPALAFRAGAVLPGGFDEAFPFAPGTRSTAIEPELIFRKHVGWSGFGVYGDALFRWNHTSANDQYITTIGLFQHFGEWELAAGYRHLGSVNGDNIEFDPDTRIVIYPRAVRENQDSIEAGFSYTTPVRRFRIGFYSRTVFDGVNTDKKFWLGGYVEMPFGLKRK